MGSCSDISLQAECIRDNECLALALRLQEFCLDIGVCSCQPNSTSLARAVGLLILLPLHFLARIVFQGAGPQACLLHVDGVPHGPFPAQHTVQPGHQGPVRRCAALSS